MHVHAPLHVQAFKLLRHAVGTLSALRAALLPCMAPTLEDSSVDADTKKGLLQPLLGDLSPHLLEALQAACCADAQVGCGGLARRTCCAGATGGASGADQQHARGQRGREAEMLRRHCQQLGGLRES